MDRNTDSLWRMERNIPVCSPHDASVELLWELSCLFLAAGSRNGLDHMKLRGWVLMVLWLFLGVLIEYQIGKI